MQHSEEQLKNFQREYALRRRQTNTVIAIWSFTFLALILVTRSGREPFPHSIDLLFGIGALVALFAVFNSRCPACRKLLRVRAPGYCPYCGVPLR
jgi:peptidoglycan/LPS O-acetylase OafA/YrhL